jgi:hypothetical protein
MCVQDTESKNDGVSHEHRTQDTGHWTLAKAVQEAFKSEFGVSLVTCLTLACQHDIGI